MTMRLPAAALLAGLLAGAQPPATWTLPREEEFLKTARIESEAPAGEGITHSRKVTLTDGVRTHAAHVQTIDIFMPLFKGKDGSEEKDFRDCWKFNVAAYRLAKLLHLTNMVPVSVPRTVDGVPAAVSWWVDDVLMDEAERVRRGIPPPDVRRWNRQMETIRVFDQLIYNVDRSRQNLLITRNWDVWMIDETRSFRKWTSLKDADAVTRCTPELLRALQQLRREDVVREMGTLLTADEIDGLMARRDLIVQKLTAGQSGTQRF
jgi:hypothetical protein